MAKKPTYKELEKQIGELKQRVAQLKKTESDYKQARDALEENITRYRTVFESANDAIFLVKKNTFVECNRKTEEIFGCTKDQIVGKTFFAFSPERQADGTPSQQKGAEKRKSAEKGVPQIFDWTHCRLDGTVFETEVSLNKIELKGEIFVQAIVRDVTTRKQAEESLLNALSEIENLKKQLEADYTYLQEEIKLSHDFDQILGQSDALKYVLFKVEQIAPVDTTVLILGETGVGKELFAGAIHNASPRKSRPLIKVSCATLPATLIESELFGHEKGAFTDAQTRQAGRFELANGTTIFLDEIGELPVELQSKLLRVIQDGEFERLGSSGTMKTDARIIAATNRNLEEDVRSGRFRKDLWYRLNVFPITIPPLRERAEDIPLLVNWLVNKFAKKFGKHIEKVPQKIMRSLQQYHWPGNVRELENVIERAVINSQGSMLSLADTFEASDTVDLASGRPKSLPEMERNHILQTLEETNWRVSGAKGAAAMLGINPSTLRGRMRKLGIRRL